MAVLISIRYWAVGMFAVLTWTTGAVWCGRSSIKWKVISPSTYQSDIDAAMWNLVLFPVTPLKRCGNSYTPDLTFTNCEQANKMHLWVLCCTQNNDDIFPLNRINCLFLFCILWFKKCVSRYYFEKFHKWRRLNINCFREYVMRHSTFFSLQLMPLWITNLCLLEVKGEQCTLDIIFWRICLKIFATGTQQCFPVSLLLSSHVAFKNRKLLNVAMETQHWFKVMCPIFCSFVNHIFQFLDRFS
jgi:hypothetical protein